MKKPLIVINGPNLNLLGTREPHIYGSTSLKDVEKMCLERATKRGYKLEFHQSNREYEIIDWIHSAIRNNSAIVINPAAFTHTSVAILDALKNFNGPIIELHISHTHQREEWRHHSYVSTVATGLIMGLGVNGYPLAVEAAIDAVEARAKAGKA
ncbi:MAG: type II 3-dehydroquinate dehydratase [Hyphomicrobiaceae bacterium]|nr:MAG: type II 3-dehydroquinate dehydratase [Hyphomicrobiaceae bacterium]